MKMVLIFDQYTDNVIEEVFNVVTGLKTVNASRVFDLFPTRECFDTLSHFDEAYIAFANELTKDHDIIILDACFPKLPEFLRTIRYTVRDPKLIVFSFQTQLVSNDSRCRHLSTVLHEFKISKIIWSPQLRKTDDGFNIDVNVYFSHAYLVNYVRHTQTGYFNI